MTSLVHDRLHSLKRAVHTGRKVENERGRLSRLLSKVIQWFVTDGNDADYEISKSIREHDTPRVLLTFHFFFNASYRV